MANEGFKSYNIGLFCRKLFIVAIVADYDAKDNTNKLIPIKTCFETGIGIVITIEIAFRLQGSYLWNETTLLDYLYK